MPRDLAASLATALLPLALLALTALGAYAARLLARYLRDRRYALAVELVALGAAGVVADIGQHVVSDLKDPAKPGAWNDIAATAVRRHAVTRLRELYPHAVAVTTGAIGDPARVDDLLGTLVEKGVVDAKRGSLSAALVEGVELSMPGDAPRPTAAPPPPDEGTAERPAGARGAL